MYYWNQVSSSDFKFLSYIAIVISFYRILKFFPFDILQEGRTIVENKTADIIQETRKLQINRQGTNSEAQNPAHYANNSWQQPKTQLQSTQPQIQTNNETQLKASRDVRLQWLWPPK